MDAMQEQSPTMTPVEPEREARPKHSGPGIASFIVGLLSMLSIIIGIIVMAVGLTDYIDDNGVLLIPDPNEFAADAAILAGILLYFLGLLLSVVGIVLGIVGCVIRNRRRVFAVTGLVLSGLVVLGTILMTLLNLAAQA